jgi:hypothetical protein
MLRDEGQGSPGLGKGSLRGGHSNIQVLSTASPNNRGHLRDELADLKPGDPIIFTVPEAPRP